MANFTFYAPTDFFQDTDSNAWSLTALSSTKAVIECGDYVIELSGTGLSVAGSGAGTITGAKLYQSSASSPTEITSLFAQSTSALSLSFQDVVLALNDALDGAEDIGSLLFSADDTITGSAGSDELFGGDGDDTLNGGAGDDYLVGDDDAYGDYDDYGDYDPLAGGNDILNGGDGNDALYGGAGNDRLDGGSGNDLLDGGFGADAMAGGSGDDLYQVDDAGDVVTEAAGGGSFDRVEILAQGTGFAAYTLGANVENARVYLTGHYDESYQWVPAQFSLTGNDLANKIEATAWDDANDTMGSAKLYGKGGNDRINGSLGNDTLDGGTGNDTLIGNFGSDTFVVDSLNDVVKEAVTIAGTQSAIDVDKVVFNVGSAATVSLGGTVSGLTNTKTYSGIEALQLASSSSTVAHNAVGNSGAEQLVGNAAANKLYGLGGSDKLTGNGGNDTLVGGAGSDTLYGNAGNDTFVLDSTSGSDTIKDFVSGTDKVKVAMSGIKVGDGDTALEGAATVASGGFAKTAELVVVTGNISGSITASSAAAKIGSASSAYAVGASALFAVDNGSSSALYLFKAADADAAVEANELTLLATLSTATSTTTGDYLFGA